MRVIYLLLVSFILVIGGSGTPAKANHVNLPTIEPNWKATRVEAVRLDPEVTSGGLTTQEYSTRIFEVLWITETKKLMEEITETLQWDLSGKTIKLELTDIPGPTGAGTLPDPADPNGIILKVEWDICIWSKSKRRRILAHELDHMRTLDDQPPGGGKTRRELRTDLDNANYNIKHNRSSATLTKRHLEAFIPYVQGQIVEETRAYNNSNQYGTQLGLEAQDLQENQNMMQLELRELRDSLNQAQQALANTPWVD